VPPLAIIPPRAECDRNAVGKAMRYLMDDWLGDVATSLSGKCVLIALGMTIIERIVIDERPTFWVTAGRRGSGKTTALRMVIEAITGIPAAAAAWSPNEEERRKALHSFLIAGVSYILWDNIPRGAQISCPHIERACTSKYYEDRKLGASETVRASAATVIMFTDNNVGPKGDLASRSLHARLSVDRPDPENRKFAHPDPLAWTRANRFEILKALYIVMLGNPTLDLPQDAPMKTRFKLWYRLVGSAIEHGTKCMQWIDPNYGKKIWDNINPLVNFETEFLSQETDDEETASLSEALVALDATMRDYATRRSKQLDKFSAVDLANALKESTVAQAATVREFLFPEVTPEATISSKTAGRRLNANAGNVVEVAVEAGEDRNGEALYAKQAWMLTAEHDRNTNTKTYSITKINQPTAA
jgi:hypothetical protein